MAMMISAFEQNISVGQTRKKLLKEENGIDFLSPFTETRNLLKPE